VEAVEEENEAGAATQNLVRRTNQIDLMGKLRKQK
jgi:hypothetical protein